MKLIKELESLVEAAGKKFKPGDAVTVKNAKKYDSLATADKMPGVVDFIWPDGRIAVTVKVGASTGQMNVDAGDLTYLQEAADPKSPEDYEELARKHTADGQQGTRSGMVYASMMAGRARRAAKILKDGGSQEAAWRHYQGTDVAEAHYTPQEKARMRAAHEYNLDAAQREIDQRSAEGEDMTGATIDPNTYEIIKPKKGSQALQFHVVSKLDGRVLASYATRQEAEKNAHGNPVLVGDLETIGDAKFVREDTTTAKTEVAESVYATDSEKLKAMPDLPVVIHKSPYEGAEVGEYTEIFVGSPKTAQQFAKYIIFKGGSARLGKRGQDIYVYHKGAGPITKRDFRMAKLEEGTGDPEEGWCVVSSDRPRIVIDGPHLDRETALKYKQSVSPAQSSGWFVLWGKEASDGSGEFIATRAVSPAGEVKEGFSEDDLAVGGTIIYKANDQYRMSELVTKLAGRKLKLMNGATCDLADVVSTDESDWPRFRDMKVTSGIKYPTEKIAEASHGVGYKQQFTKWGVVPKSKKMFVTFFKTGEEQQAKDFAEKTGGKLIKVDQAGREIKEMQEAYELGLDPDKRVVIKGVHGMKSIPFSKRFKNLAAYEAWLDREEAEDYEIFAVMNESTVQQEAAYADDLDPDKPITVKGFRGMQSKPFKKRFKNMAALEDWLEYDGDDVQPDSLEVTNESTVQQEAFKLGDRVMIVKGPKDAMGKEGIIGEIRRGLYIGAPKEFTIDYDYDEKTGNSKSIRARAGEIKAVKEAARAKTEVAEAAYVDDLDPNKPIIVRGFRGMQSKPFKKRFKNMDAFEAWLEDEGDDVQQDGMEVTNESVKEPAHCFIEVVASVGGLMVLRSGEHFSLRAGGKRYAKMSHADWEHLAAAVKNRVTVTAGGITLDPHADSWELKDPSGLPFATLDASEMDQLMADAGAYLELCSR